MTIDDLPPDDPRRELFEQANRIANAPRSDQLAWLDELRETLADRPNVDNIVRDMDAYLLSTRQLGGARVQHAQLGERMEAQYLSKLNELLELPDSHWKNTSDDQLRGVAQLAVLSHLLQPLLERCQEPDAQDRLKFILENYLFPSERVFKRSYWLASRRDIRLIMAM